MRILITAGIVLCLWTIVIDTVFGANSNPTTNPLGGSAGSSQPICYAHWQSIGPFHVQHNYTGINLINDPEDIGAIHSVWVSGDIAYVGGVNGGVWKTMNFHSTATFGGPHWVPLTDQMDCLSIGAVAGSLDDTNLVVAGCGFQSNSAQRGGEARGAMITKDGGATWQMLTGFPQGYWISSITVSGTGASGTAIIVIAVKQPVTIYSGTTGAVVDPYGVGSNVGGIWVSQNGGTTFSQVYSAGGVTKLYRHPTTPTTIYASALISGSAGSWTAASILVSTNSGVSWAGTAAAPNPGASQCTSQTTLTNVQVTVGAARIYAGYYLEGGTQTCYAMFKSDDGGSTWSAIANIPSITDYTVSLGYQGLTNFAMMAYPSDSKTLFVAGTGSIVYRVDTSTNTWTQISTPTSSVVTGTTRSKTAPHADARNFAWDAQNGTLLLTNDGGVYSRSYPLSSTLTDGDWTSLAGDLSIPEIYVAAYDPISGAIALGAQDNTVMISQFDGTVQSTGIWSYLLTGDGTSVAVDTSVSPAQFYGSDQYLAGWFKVPVNANSAFGGVNSVVTTFSGTFGTCNPGDSTNCFDFVPATAANRINPSNVLVCTADSKCYKSTFPSTTSVFEFNVADWSLTGFPTAYVYGGYRNGVANPDVIFAVSQTFVWSRDVNTCASKTCMHSYSGSSCSSCLPGSMVRTTVLWQNSITNFRSVAQHPTDYYINAIIDDSGHVWLTLDFGQSWRDVTIHSNLLAVSGHTSVDTMGTNAAVFINTTINGVQPLLIGTTYGTFVTFTTLSSSANYTFVKFGAHLPKTIVQQFIYTQSTDLLLAVTFGRGIFAIQKISEILVLANNGNDTTTINFACTTPLYPNVPNAYGYISSGILPSPMGFPSAASSSSSSSGAAASSSSSTGAAASSGSSSSTASGAPQTSFTVTTGSHTTSGCSGGIGAAFKLNGNFETALSLTSGVQYSFTGSFSSSHTFAITTDLSNMGASTSGDISGTAIIGTGTINWTPTAGSYRYICTIHNCMGFTITVTDPVASSSTADSAASSSSSTATAASSSTGAAASSSSNTASTPSSSSSSTGAVSSSSSSTGSTGITYSVGLQVARSYSCSVASSTTYAFTLNGVESPALTLTAGVPVTFNINVGPFYPFAITTDTSLGGTTAGVVAGPLSGTGPVTWTPVYNGIYYYECTSSGYTCMGDSITVTGGIDRPSSTAGATAASSSSSSSSLSTAVVSSSSTTTSQIASSSSSSTGSSIGSASGSSSTGTATPSNSNCTTIGGCACLPGYTSTSRSIIHCDPCPVATYKPTSSLDSCTKCPTYSSAPMGSTLASACTCLSSFTVSSDGTCSMARSGDSSNSAVLVTFSVQSSWAVSIPPSTDVSLQGQQPFKDSILASLSQALGINLNRLTIDSLNIDTTVNATTGGIYVLVGVVILPSSTATGTDSSLDSSGQPYTPTQLAQFIELLSGNSESALFSGTFTKTIRPSSLTAVAKTEPVVETVSWENTTTGTAIIFFGAVLILLLLMIGLSKMSPSTARVEDLATVILAITNTVTNFTFILYLNRNLDTYDFSGALYASLVFFFVPLCFNLVITIIRMVQLVRRTKIESCGVVPMNEAEWEAHKKSDKYRQTDVKEIANPHQMTFHEWFMKYTPSTLLICVLSVLSIDCLALLTSQILWRPEFSAPWSEGKRLVNILGLIDVIFRDLPQLIIQIAVTQRNHTWSTLQEVSVVSSGTAVFFGLLVRGVTLLLRNIERERKRLEQETEVNEIELIQPKPGSDLVVPIQSGLDLDEVTIHDPDKVLSTESNHINSPTANGNQTNVEADIDHLPSSLN